MRKNQQARAVGAANTSIDRRSFLRVSLTAGGGPKGVGDAVNQSVVITFMLLFVTNFVLTAVYFQLVPAKLG